MAPSTRVRLRVTPGARRNEVVGRHGDGWKVRVAAAPEGGRANEAVLDLLAERLELPRRSLSIVSGHSAREKVVLMEGIDRAEGERRLERSAPSRRLRRRPQADRALPRRPSAIADWDVVREKDAS
jgi:uncharacterized protein (TIGR00251 family)